METISQSPFSFFWNLGKHVRKRKGGERRFLPFLLPALLPRITKGWILWYTYSSLYLLIVSKEDQPIRVKSESKSYGSCWYQHHTNKEFFDVLSKLFVSSFLSLQHFDSLCPEINSSSHSLNESKSPRWNHPSHPIFLFVQKNKKQKTERWKRKSNILLFLFLPQPVMDSLNYKKSSSFVSSQW